MRLKLPSALAQALILTIASACVVTAHARPSMNAGKTGASTSAREAARVDDSVGLTTTCDMSLAAGLLRANDLLSPASPDAVAGPGLEARIKDCERQLRACINGGGDPTACWNAYWRCSSR